MPAQRRTASPRTRARATNLRALTVEGAAQTTTPRPPMLHDFAQHLSAAGRSAGTIRIRLEHLEHLQRRHPDLGTVTLDDLEADLARRAALGQRPETRKSARSSYRTFYAWTHRTGRATTNPAAELAPIRIPTTVPRIAPDLDVELALMRSTSTERAMIALGRFACLRLTEIATLHTRHREGDAIRVTGKGDKQRLVYLNDDALQALLALEREQGPGYYFPGLEGPHMHPQSVHKIIKRRTGWNPHALRHAGATAAYRATRDLRAVQLMLGHSSMATTQRYLHVDEDSLRAAAAGTALHGERRRAPIAA